MSTPTSDLDSSNVLSSDQVRQFHRDGYLAPLTACSPEAMVDYREHCTALLKTDNETGRREHNRHLDDATVWSICALPGIVNAMTSVLGSNLLLWRTNFFNKEPGGKEIPWHQDRNYWPIEPEIVVSAWLALDRADTENSCVQVVPGTHRQIIPHIKAGEEMAFTQMADTSGVDLSKTLDIILEPGQFILFNERTLHHSEPNRSNRRRMGLAIRAILPQVRVLEFDSPSHRLMQLSGTDPMGFNLIGPPPTEAVI